MNASGARRAALVLAGVAVLSLAPVPAPAQAPAATHEVHSGDTLFSIARRTRYSTATLNQMLLAIYRANPDAFVGGNINRLIVGRVLAIPGREQVLSVSQGDAFREVQALLAVKPPAPPPPEVKPPPVKPPAEAARPGPAAPLGREEAAKRYREGLALERRGDVHGALKAFLEAGESGNGLAQRKLGEIYDKGNAAVPRDYETALKWYQRAREQGVPIPKPFVRSPR